MGNSGKCRELTSIFRMSTEINLRWIKSSNHDLRVKNLQARLKRLQQDSKWAKWKWGWKLKVMYCTADVCNCSPPTWWVCFPQSGQAMWSGRLAASWHFTLGDHIMQSLVLRRLAMGTVGCDWRIVLVNIMKFLCQHCLKSKSFLVNLERCPRWVKKVWNNEGNGTMESVLVGWLFWEAQER